jgi:hypothetical protein
MGPSLLGAPCCSRVRHLRFDECGFGHADCRQLGPPTWPEESPLGASYILGDCDWGTRATTLLSSSGSVDDALTAVKSTASVVCGLPVAVIMCYLIQSVTLLCRAAEKQDCGTDYCFPKQPEFKVSVYGGMSNALEVAASFWRVSNSPTKYAISALVAWLWLLSYAVLLSLLFGVSF